MKPTFGTWCRLFRGRTFHFLAADGPPPAFAETFTDRRGPACGASFSISGECRRDRDLPDPKPHRTFTPPCRACVKWLAWACPACLGRSKSVSPGVPRCEACGSSGYRNSDEGKERARLFAVEEEARRLAWPS